MLYDDTIYGLSFVLYDEVYEKCALRGHYAASSGNFLPMFRDDLLFHTSRAKYPKRPRRLLTLVDVADRLSPNFGNNYHYTL